MSNSLLIREYDTRHELCGRFWLAGRPDGYSPLFTWPETRSQSKKCQKIWR